MEEVLEVVVGEVTRTRVADWVVVGTTEDVAGGDVVTGMTTTEVVVGLTGTGTGATVVDWGAGAGTD